MDLGIYKNTAITERFKLQLRLELYNAFNHANFYVYGADTDTSSYGFVDGYRGRAPTRTLPQPAARREDHFLAGGLKERGGPSGSALFCIYAKKIFQVVTTRAWVTIDARMLRARRNARP